MKGMNIKTDRAAILSACRDRVENETFCQVFYETAMMYPDRTAVVDEQREVTYRQLLQWADVVAYRLKMYGVRKEEVVAIRTGRRIESVAAMLGIWKSGCAYVYLDHAYPEERSRSIIEECGCRIEIDQVWWEEFDREKPIPDISDVSEPGGLAVIIYTSGSTSKPKGVMVEHRNVIAAMYSFQIFEITAGEHFGLFAGMGFVAALSDIVTTLSVGAVLYMIPGEIRRDIRALIAYYREHEIRVTFLPPHMARKLLAFEEDDLPLRLLLVGSEVVRKLRKAPFRIFNVYGASEMCAMIAHYEITDDGGEEIYPVGTLNPGLKGYLVTEEGRLARLGEEGELWLAGRQVSRGYYRLPELTESHYIGNPFSSEAEYERVFKTNDILIEREDGNLQYVCRKDNVFKVRGFRVESTAVEHAMLECAPISEAVAKIFTDSGGCNILCGYFTARERLDVKEIKKRMKEKIPYYMIPTCMIQLDAFPLNANMKIDRGAIEPPRELNNHKLLEQLY